MTQRRRGPKPGSPSARRRKPAKPRLDRRGPILRILPLMILVAAVMLGFRVTVVVQDVRGMLEASVDVSQSTALAQMQPEIRVDRTGGDAGAEAAPEGDASAPVEETMAADEAAGGEALDMTGAAGITAGGPPLPINTDPSQFTRSEIELLQRLAERREVIEAREKELETREAMLKAAEARIDRKVTELQQLEVSLQNLVQEADTQQRAKIDQLVRIYGAMKPKDAARIFNDLEMPILLQVVENMKENKVAPILAEMEAVRATALTEELSARKRLPGLETENQG